MPSIYPHKNKTVKKDVAIKGLSEKSCEITNSGQEMVAMMLMQILQVQAILGIKQIRSSEKRKVTYA